MVVVLDTSEHSDPAQLLMEPNRLSLSITGFLSLGVAGFEAGNRSKDSWL